MLRPGYRLLGGCYFNGNAAVRRRRLCASREVMFANKPQEEEQAGGQAARL